MGFFEGYPFYDPNQQQSGDAFGIVQPSLFGMNLHLPAQAPGFAAAPTDMSSANRNSGSGVTLPQTDASGFGRDAGETSPLLSLFSGIGNGIGNLFSGGLASAANAAGAAGPGAAQPQATPPGPAAAGPGLGDRLTAALASFAGSRGLLPALTGAMTGAATGQRMDPHGMMLQQQAQTERALVGAGASPAEARAAALNPEVFKTIAPKYLGENYKVIPFGSTMVDNHGKVLFAGNSGAQFHRFVQGAGGGVPTAPAAAPTAAAAPQAALPQMPQIGEVRKGHRFFGGNPADPASWQKVQ